MAAPLSRPATPGGPSEADAATAQVIQDLIDALGEPGTIHPGFAAHVVDELTILLGYHRHTTGLNQRDGVPAAASDRSSAAG